MFGGSNHCFEYLLRWSLTSLSRSRGKSLQEEQEQKEERRLWRLGRARGSRRVPAPAPGRDGRGRGGRAHPTGCHLGAMPAQQNQSQRPATHHYALTTLGSCHKRQTPQAPTPHAPIRNRKTRKVANAKLHNRYTCLLYTSPSPRD